MKIYSGFSDKRLNVRPRAVAIGVFDGVHLGHQKIVRAMCGDAVRLRLSPCVVTFDPHPSRVLGRGDSDSGVLLSLDHRLSLLGRLGVRECVVVRFDRAFAAVPAETFLEELLVGRLGMRSLSVGSGFRFGRHAAGDERLLRDGAARFGYRFHAVTPLKRSGEIVSSTRIRRMILEGRLRAASALLGRPYAVVGTVVSGRGRGRGLGFPTANLDPHHEILPPDGVYAAASKIDGRVRAAGVSIGPRPTFGDREKTLEVHFPGLSKNLYGKDIELEFRKRLRPLRRFSSPQALANAIRSDIEKTLNLLR